MPKDPYDIARNDFIYWSSSCKSISPIEFGKVGCPGVSDLDLGIILNSNPSINLKEHLENLPTSVQKLMNGGSLMVFPESIFKYINYIDDIDITFLIKDIDVIKLKHDEVQSVNIIQIIEWLPERLIKIFQDGNNNFPSPRRSVGYLYSLCYTLKKINNLLIKKSTCISKYINDVIDLRSNWETLSIDQRNVNLKEISASALKVGFKAAKLFTEDKSLAGIMNHSKDYPLCNYNLHSNAFIQGSENDCFSFTIKEIGSVITITIPNIFLFSYIQYSIGNSKLSQKISQRMSNLSLKESESLMPLPYKDIINKRISFMSSCFDFVTSFGLNSGLYKFGWYL